VLPEEIYHVLTVGGVVSGNAATLNVELARPVKVPSVAVMATAVPVVRNVVVIVVVDWPAVKETPVVYVHELGPEYEMVLLHAYEVTMFLN